MNTYKIISKNMLLSKTFPTICITFQKLREYKKKISADVRSLDLRGIEVANTPVLHYRQSTFNNNNNKFLPDTTTDVECVWLTPGKTIGCCLLSKADLCGKT